ncbi:hypothetical protein CCHR01_02226 [Colletotrichum chrysophilum]|uniref:Heterokaryon incompatibility domain-containing protein n=1 Tax=Colletotrichum chrysophilum TaxID=1836956 RepID=A0AAD9EKI7_9PEZI|nr:hypothetical protein CCHR01_02226 [Colletotrichum chrysophilum]
MQPLCTYCRDIPFRSLARKQPLLDRLASFPLGNLMRITASDCPFFHVVTQAVQLELIPALNDEWQEVFICWSEDLGPAASGAFYVYGSRRCIICFAGGNEESLETFQGRVLLRPKIERFIDFERISQWISSCETGHASTCGQETKSFSEAYLGLEVLRLIDVHDPCLVEVIDIRPYIALSYVWGGVSTFRMTRANLPRFLKQKALEPLLRIPETIRDTIELARRLNIRYIWVDAFCLIQDDPEDLLQGISVMDNIFERSWLTAVAASGHTANSGLPGFSGGSRVPREATVIQPNISMTVFMDLDGMMDSTVYQTRGWTFQESSLSHRALYFFENEVFFRCRRTDVSEFCIDQAHNPILAAHGDTLSAPKNLKLAMELLNPLRDYACILEHYTTRVLSDPCDTIRALAGINRRVEDKLGQEIVEGLPAGRLERFMLFRSASGGGLSRRRSAFPSWTWAGWHDQITLEPPTWREPMRGYTWNETRHWISWYKRETSGAVRKLSNHYKADGFYSRAPISGCDRYEPKFPKPFGIDIKKPGQITDTGLSNESTSYPVLQFWTLAVYFRVSVPDFISGESDFIGKDGISRGSLRMEGLEEMTGSDLENVFEVILLSEDIERDSKDNSWIFYNVMLLDNRHHPPERRGLGQLSLSDLEQSVSPGPQWKQMTLG